jgi:DNA mismatch repair protein MutS
MEVIYDKQKDCLVYNRKLKDGAGSFLYGLEVCKSLSLPEEFLSIAHNIRVKYFSTDTSSSVLDLNTSHYNSSHISGGICDKCKTGEAEEAHHLIYQQNANEKGIIEKEGEGLVFHKHNAANLVNLCRKCHDLIHKSKKQYKKTKTTNGFILEEV